jgi:hypothetical protein
VIFQGRGTYKMIKFENWDSCISGATSHGLNYQETGVKFPAGAGDFLLDHRV